MWVYLLHSAAEGFGNVWYSHNSRGYTFSSYLLPYYWQISLMQENRKLLMSNRTGIKTEMF